ncbi:MAG: hypothetical protein GKS06_06190 [Acidobacteria bacterium]|nr:hypothetical protein [Acidobacteriota bacterium]
MHEPSESMTDPFQVGEWTVFPLRNEICGRDGVVVELEPKVAQLLVVLTEAAGEVVSRDDLHAALWPGTFVTDKALTGAVAKLRKALDDDVTSPRFVATIPKRGYRLVAPVVAPPSDESALQAAAVGAAQQGRLYGVRVRVATGIAVGLLVALVGGTAWSGLVDRPDPGPAAIQVTSAPGFELHPAISPGGETVAYTAADADDNWDIYLRRPGSDSALRLTEHPYRDVRPIWSPDGTQIAFMRFDDTSCRLMVMPALGGEATQITWCSEFVPAQVFWGPKPTWSPDGRFIAWPYRDTVIESVAIHFVDVATGTSHRVTSPPDWHADAAPAFSPDGQWLAFSRRGYAAAEVWAIRLDESGLAASSPRQITFEARTMMGHAWLADGRELLVSSQRDGTFSLWAYPIEGGTPRWVPAPGENLKEPSVARTGGRLVYENWNYDENIWRADLGAAAIVTTSRGSASAAAEPPTSQWIASSLWDSEPAYSPDGARIAFVSNRSGAFEIWSANADGSAARRVTSIDGGAIGPIAWHPNSELLLFEARPQGVAQIFSIPALGGLVRQVTEGPHENVLPVVSPDGKRLWFTSNRTDAWEIWSVALDEAVADGAPEQVTSEGAYAARVTGDGRTLLFTRHAEPGLWAQPVDGGAAREVVPELRGSDFGNWTVHQRHVVYLRRTAERRGTEVVAVDLDTAETRTLFAPGGTILASRRGLSVSPDGRYLLYTQMDDASSDLVVVENLLR